MCIDWIELFVRIFLISPHLKIHFSWKDVSHQLVNTALPLPFPKKIISCIWPKPLITDATTEHKQYLNDVALRTVRYSCRFSTNLFTHSVNSTNTTVHILQCVTVMDLNTLQHFPPGSTSTPLSHTRLHLTNRLVLQNGRPCIDALTYLYVYFLSAIYILVSGGGKKSPVHV